MPTVKQHDRSARMRLKHRTQGFDNREPYRQAIASLKGDVTIELIPDEGESVRKIKLNLSRAAKEMGVEIKYGDSTDNSVLAWLQNAEPVRRRPGRPRKNPVAE
jgi:hypothetical protein